MLNTWTVGVRSATCQRNESSPIWSSSGIDGGLRYRFLSQCQSCGCFGCKVCTQNTMMYKLASMSRQQQEMSLLMWNVLKCCESMWKLSIGAASSKLSPCCAFLLCCCWAAGIPPKLSRYTALAVMSSGGWGLVLLSPKKGWFKNPQRAGSSTCWSLKVLNLLDNFDNLTFTFKCQGNLRVYGARAYAVSMLQGFKALESLRNAWAWPSSSSRSASGQISAAWKKCEGSQEIRKKNTWVWT